mmetsp:Transcript_23333/g.41434  ORF Transcript_23333/g.41434 Transcript_23333/m.41434 type:complete len:145 (-) Transcript_23333:24-458(-)
MSHKANWLKRKSAPIGDPRKDKVYLSLASFQHRASIEVDIKNAIKEVILNDEPPLKGLPHLASDTLKTYFGFGSLAPRSSFERSFSCKLPPISTQFGSPVKLKTIGHTSGFKEKSLAFKSLRLGRGGRPVARLCHLDTANPSGQ